MVVRFRFHFDWFLLTGIRGFLLLNENHQTYTNAEYKFDKYGHMQCLMLILKQQEGHSGPPSVTFNAPAGHPVLSHARLGARCGSLAIALQSGGTVFVPGAATRSPSSQATEV